MHNGEDLGKIINDTLHDEHYNDVNNEFIELAKDVIQKNKNIMLNTAEAIRELRDELQELQFTRRTDGERANQFYAEYGTRYLEQDQSPQEFHHLKQHQVQHGDYEHR